MRLRANVRVMRGQVNAEVKVVLKVWFHHRCTSSRRVHSWYFRALVSHLTDKQVLYAAGSWASST